MPALGFSLINPNNRELIEIYPFELFKTMSASLQGNS